MQFISLNNEAELESLATSGNCQVILKHNTSCSISQGVVDRLKGEEADIESLEGIYVLDLLANRELSNTIAGRFGVPHQSPQVLVVKDGRCTYHEWGYDISADAIRRAVEKA